MVDLLTRLLLTPSYERQPRPFEDAGATLPLMSQLTGGVRLSVAPKLVQPELLHDPASSRPTRAKAATASSGERPGGSGGSACSLCASWQSARLIPSLSAAGFQGVTGSSFSAACQKAKAAAFRPLPVPLLACSPVAAGAG